jgi:hypothetical protein
MELTERTALAYFLIAGVTADAELAQAAYAGMGFDVTWHGSFVLHPGNSTATRIREPSARVAYPLSRLEFMGPPYAPLTRTLDERRGTDDIIV